MNETETHICTECFFTGEPNISAGRLSIEFILNFLLGSGGGVPLFQKVRHCPECRSHSMALITSEAGQIALAESNKRLIEKTQCDLCGENLSIVDSSQDTQLCQACQEKVFEQQSSSEKI